MGVKRQDHRGSFTATAGDGRRFTLHIRVDILDDYTLENPGGESEGLKRLTTDDGDPVNRISQGHYQLVMSGLDLRSADPNAP